MAHPQYIVVDARKRTLISTRKTHLLEHRSKALVLEYFRDHVPGTRYALVYQYGYDIKLLLITYIGIPIAKPSGVRLSGRQDRLVPYPPYPL